MGKQGDNGVLQPQQLSPMGQNLHRLETELTSLASHCDTETLQQQQRQRDRELEQQQQQPSLQLLNTLMDRVVTIMEQPVAEYDADRAPGADFRGVFR